MRATTSIRTALSVAAMTFALASAAQATATRTYVSGTGLDTNTASNCPRTAPCKTFVGAYSVTQAGGEIVALDVAAYGPLTITGGLTIIGVDGGIITVQSSTTGITINAAGTDVVILRNLQITGAAGSSSTKGIVLNTGKLVLQNSSLKGLSTGLSVNSAKADVTDTDFVGNTIAIATTGQGADPNATPVAGPTTVRISNGNVLNNGTAYQMNDPGVSATCATCNRLSIYGRNNGAGVAINHNGNTNLALGSGPSCDPTVPSGCKAIGNYSTTVNNQGP